MDQTDCKQAISTKIQTIQREVIKLHHRIEDQLSSERQSGMMFFSSFRYMEQLLQKRIKRSLNQKSQNEDDVHQIYKMLKKVTGQITSWKCILWNMKENLGGILKESKQLEAVYEKDQNAICHFSQRFNRHRRSEIRLSINAQDCLQLYGPMARQIQQESLLYRLRSFWKEACQQEQTIQIIKIYVQKNRFC